MKILLIGPQGSGKSTQAELLAKELNLPRVSTGDIFRELAQENSEEGQRIRETMNEGKLIDDAETAKIVERRLQKDDAKNGFIIDGYPMTIEQVNIFEPDFDKVIYLNVLREEVVRRLLQRGRTDDTEELINKRLDLYYQQTQSLLDHYKQQGILIEVDGIGTVEKIQDEIRKHIEKS